MITTKQMRVLERAAAKKGIFAGDLMENAGKEVYLAVKEKYGLNGKHVVVFAGHGNNGGDGLVSAKYFSSECPVIILFFGEKDKLSEEALEKYEEIKHKIKIVKISSKEDLDKFHLQKEAHFIFVDALLGVGIKGEARVPISLGIDYFNSLTGDKIAIDVPSGIDADTGEAGQRSCEVDFIVTLHDVKVGLERYLDKTVVVDIGLLKKN